MSEQRTYGKELDVALAAARAAGEIVLRYYHSDTGHWEKSKDNPLTLADLESDRVIGEHLRAAFPGDAILSEESVDDASRLTNPRVWIVDPVDGTKEFTKRIPEFGVSIALTVRGEPVVGVILNPAAGSAVWASLGSGTFRDGTRVQVSSTAKLADAAVIASRTEISRDLFKPYDGWFAELRPLGSIAWKLACIASGEGDLNISVAPKNEWDVCAGDVLVREAGGIYVAFDRTTRRYNQAKTLIDAGMLAGSPVLVDAFLARERARSV
jgi:myo-inositol-1(or 4)-monophosphatase